MNTLIELVDLEKFIFEKVMKPNLGLCEREECVDRQFLMLPSHKACYHEITHGRCNYKLFNSPHEGEFFCLGNDRGRWYIKWRLINKLREKSATKTAVEARTGEPPMSNRGRLYIYNDLSNTHNNASLDQEFRQQKQDN
ncbi:hypothetical protein HW555_003633 [Spodoptera exigua]|uniref:Uncharacterized protein n=1 Tax=Spodoptera exigua TaxID=7107 RepID=A0A835L6W5_SPOEX|nr:hypothetical protein HW555_003633 [Spodoptera exigua]